jgi:hypothetical protein
MRSFRLCLCLAVIFCFCTAIPAGAQNANPVLPPILTAGLDSYRNVGLDQAFRAWLRNSPLHWEPAMAAPLRAAQEQYGTFESWDVIDDHALAPTTQIVYLVMNYQQGPVFAKFVVYQTEQQGWVVTSLKFSLDDSILPALTLQ